MWKVDNVKKKEKNECEGIILLKIFSKENVVTL